MQMLAFSSEHHLSLMQPHRAARMAVGTVRLS